jgi:Lar family restriction alleviation protein
MSELKPCPFCGSKYLGIIAPVEKAYQVQCGDCYASASVEQTKKKAIAAWNRRAKNATD